MFSSYNFDFVQWTKSLAHFVPGRNYQLLPALATNSPPDCLLNASRPRLCEAKYSGLYFCLKSSLRSVLSVKSLLAFCFLSKSILLDCIQAFNDCLQVCNYLISTTSIQPQKGRKKAADKSYRRLLIFSYSVVLFHFNCCS